jgi:tetratricopeptide (TPR) repeat protein
VRLGGFIESLDQSEDPDRALLDHVLEEADRRSPELAAAVRFCALPRRFDSEIIGVLRGTPEDTERNAALLQQLLDYPFVRVREKGGYVYHDSVRAQLLADWQHDERRGMLEDLTWRLVRHHEETHARAVQAEEDAARVSTIVQEASPARFRQIAAAVETGLSEPLMEAISQLALLSPKSALGFLHDYLESYLDRGRFSTSRALISASRDVVIALPEGDERASVLDWLEFEEGLMLVRVEQPADAEEKLASLLASDPSDDRLRYWTLGELGQAQRSQFELREAIETFEKEVALNEDRQVDPVNLPISYLRLARTYLLMDRPDLASAHVATSLAAAEESGDLAQLLSPLEVRAQCELEAGRRADGFDTTMRALDVVRTELRTRRAPRAALNRLLAHYFAGTSVELLDTLLGEGDALVAALDNPLVPLRRHVEKIDWFLQSGQLRRARALAAVAESEVETVGSDAVRAELSYRKADLARLEGSFEEAAEEFAECDAAASRVGRADLVAYARRGRALALSRQGRWGEVDDLLEGLEQTWRTHGHDGFAALARAERAGAARHRGDPAQGDRLLSEAGVGLEGAGPALRADFLRALAEHEAACGRLAAAGSALAESARLSESVGRRVPAAEARSMLAALAAAEGGWTEADAEARAAAGLLRELAESNDYEQSPEREAGDRYNADGLRALLSDDPTTLASAIGLFRAALEHAPNPWYRLNSAYAAAALGDWGAAVDALAEVLDESPEMRCSTLRRRLAEFHVARGRALLDGGWHGAAADAFADSLERLDRSDHAEARLRCLLGLGDSLRLAQDVDGSAAAYREAEAGGSARATLRLGELMAEHGDRDAAVEAFRDAARSEDTEVAAESAIRLTELLEDSPEEVDRAVELVRSTGGPEAALTLGNGLAARGRTRAAGQVYGTVQSELPEASLRLGELRRDEGDLAAARAAFERARTAPDRVIRGAAAARLGEVLRAEDDLHGAVEAFREAADLGDEDAQPWAALQLGEILLGLGSPREAEYWLQLAASRDDPLVSPRALLHLGDLMAASLRRSPAQDAYRRALTSADVEVSALAGLRLLDALPADAPASLRDEIVAAVLRSGGQTALRLADLLADRGDREAAQGLLRRVEELDDDLYAPDAALRLGELLVEAGDREEARSFYRRALESEDGTVAPDAALRLIDDTDEPAEETVERVIEFGGLSAVRMGDLLRERGDHELAKRAYRHVAGVERDPFAPDAERRLSDDTS